MEKRIRRALLSVYHKEGIEPIAKKLHELGVEMVSTGGTFDFITSLGLPCTPVDNFTHYPSMLHGRVKTLHPTIFGGILCQREDPEDSKEVAEHLIPLIDLVLVDLYPFEATVASGKSEAENIEKIDIGGISLIRAAAKNFHDVLVVSSQRQYASLLDLLENSEGTTSLGERKQFARAAFAITSAYDVAIFNYFDEGSHTALRIAKDNPKILRYGENPHQRGYYFGHLEEYFDKLQGKKLSYNNLQDIAAAIELMTDFQEYPTFAVLKHTNPCGLAMRNTISEAYKAAYQADTESVFGGILIANRSIDKATAEAIGDLFFEVLIAPDFDMESLPILSKKTKRILLVQKKVPQEDFSLHTAIDGFLVQEKDKTVEGAADAQCVSTREPSERELQDCLFAQRIVKHCKSNAIAVVKNGQLLASGIGQTSRVASLKQALEKAQRFGFDLHGAVVASDAFFPFSDCVKIASQEGISAFIQPGGSMRDQESIDSANKMGVSMLFTGVRHFKH